MFTDVLYRRNGITLPAVNPDPVPHVPQYPPQAGNYLTGLRYNVYQNVAEVVATGIEDSAVPYPIRPISPVKQIRILPLPVLSLNGVPPNG